MKRFAIAMLCLLAGLVRADLGSFDIGDTVTFMVRTHDATGAQTDADAVPSYRIYEGLTTPAIATGNMAKLDDPNTVGLYGGSASLAAVTGYEAGKMYHIDITAPVAGITGGVGRTFQIGAKVNMTDIEGVDATDQLATYARAANIIPVTFDSNCEGNTVSFSPAPAGITTTNPPRDCPMLLIIASGEAAGHMYGIDALSFVGGSWKANLDRTLEEVPAGANTGYIVVGTIPTPSWRGKY